MKTEALRNLWKDLRGQLRRRGALVLRLRCVLSYWRRYAAARRRGLERGAARLAALDAMAEAGLLSRVVTVSWPDGLRAELDLFAACFLAPEVVDDGAYRAPGFEPRPGGVVVDVGAHQGLFSLQAARAVGPSGRVLSVEPDPFNRALLERNLAANGAAWASVAAAAASDRAGESTLHKSRMSTGASSLVFEYREGRDASVRTERLDDLVAARGASQADLVKIDVEGAWRLVFAGAPRLLARRPRLVMEVEGDEAEVGAAMARLGELGYTVERRGSVLFARPGKS